MTEDKNNRSGRNSVWVRLVAILVLVGILLTMGVSGIMALVSALR